ncbi:hypothetical protein PCK2_000630 [Pneumocystis canis]|nr:hypothetical protein PCK2_000630 [Pneumocystis canis]
MSLLLTLSNKKALSMLFIGIGSGIASYYIYHRKYLSVLKLRLSLCLDNYTKPSNKKTHQLEKKAESIYNSVSSHMKDAYHSGKKQITDMEKSCEKKVHDWMERIDHKS